MDFSELIRIDFKKITNKDFESLSVKEIKYHDTYDNMEPKIGGLLDPSLGTTNLSIKCHYCGQSSIDCEGHWGHINLGRYQFHKGFINHVISILQVICLDTCQLLIERSEKTELILKKKRKNRLSEISKLCSSIKTSPYTGYPIPKVSLDIKKKTGIISIVCEYGLDTEDEKNAEFMKSLDKDSELEVKSNSVKKILTPEDCFNILQCINEYDCELIGYGKNPEDMILKVYPISPVAIRPSLRGDQFSVGYGENNLTQKLADIVKWNNKYVQEYNKYLNTNELSKNIIDYNSLVQYHIYTYYDNDSKDLPRSDLKTGGQPSKSLTSRYKGGKTGRIRGNLMAKRVNYSARSVITSDPQMNTNELGVPIFIAKKITYPMVITKENLDDAMLYASNAKSVYPGSTFLEDNSSGKKIMYDVRYINLNQVKPGMILHRHLIDGDVVLFNRQPSLHKMSMMAHYVKIIDDPKLLTLRVNVSACAPYNADFDGRTAQNICSLCA